MNQSSQAQFTTKLDVWVARVANNGQPSFCNLLKSLPGIYPSEVLKSLRRLMVEGLVSKEYENQIAKESKIPTLTKRAMRQGGVMFDQLEHPLDFEWRFTRNALGILCKKIEQLTLAQSMTVLCLGCPSVYAFGRDKLPSHNFVLRDKNATALGQMAEINALANFDLSHEPMPCIHADIAVIDPPWYNDYYKLFIWAALQNLKANGYIILSFPPAGTRPSAREDFNEIINWCFEAGVHLQEHLESQLSYRSPLFEVNALKSENLYGVPLDWRHGDLVVLKITKKNDISRPSIPKFATNWTEKRFGLVRIKIREDMHIADAILTPASKSAILASVSSRHPDRANANVVTSGNRFLQTGFPKELAELFHNLTENLEDNLADSFLRRELIQLLKLEQAEISEYLVTINDF